MDLLINALVVVGLVLLAVLAWQIGGLNALIGYTAGCCLAVAVALELRRLRE